MSTSIYPDYPPELSPDTSKYLVRTIQDWSIAHGLAVRPAPNFVSQNLDPNTSLAVTAPVTLFPSPFPRACFDKAQVVQRAYNELYARLASDEEWLTSIVEGLVGIDDFTASLWDVHEKVKQEGYVQNLSLGMFRSDYMVHVEGDPGHSQASIRQVEFNTIASSFGGLSTQVSAMHDFLAASGALPTSASSVIKAENLRLSESVKRLAAGLAAAHKAYGKGTTEHPNCVIFIVQDPERNVFDQRHLEYELFYTHKVRSFRLPFAEVLRSSTLDSDRTLLYKTPHSQEYYEVTTLYFRAGYSPTDFANEGDWTARLHLERSRAIKCPSILTHLAGAKKVQQVLATPSSPHLSRFVPDITIAESIKTTFAPIYPLDTSEAGQEARKLALDAETAAKYVLKPQREGGGNNIYRRKIPDFLSSIPEAQWPAYILMEMIEPPPLRNMILRNGEVQEGGVIGELGIYGVVLWRNKIERGVHQGVEEIMVNEEAGYLLRTKGDTSEEGGVAAGFGAVDSVLLVDV